MQSKNKKTPNAAERRHIARIKEMDCAVCGAAGPSECHEINQGQWFTSMPLCPSCHRGSLMGIHGQRRAWAIAKMDELAALNVTIERLMNQ
jgi:ribosomal protein S27AE